MKSPYVYKTYSTPHDDAYVRDMLTETFLKHGYKQEEGPDGTIQFRNPFITFSSKKPITCISRIRFHLNPGPGVTQVVTGVAFTKIRYYTIFVMTLICVIVPIALSIWQHGRPEIPPMSIIGVPLGFLVHYHVRARVFRTIRHMIEWME